MFIESFVNEQKRLILISFLSFLRLTFPSIIIIILLSERRREEIGERENCFTLFFRCYKILLLLALHTNLITWIHWHYGLHQLSFSFSSFPLILVRIFRATSFHAKCKLSCSSKESLNLQFIRCNSTPFYLLQATVQLHLVFIHRQSLDVSQLFCAWKEKWRENENSS